MPKKNKAKKKRKKSIREKSLHIHKQKSAPNKAYIAYYEYTITDEPLKLIKIPPELEKETEELFCKVYEKPEEVIGRLENLIKTYPNIPQFYNYLSVAYSRIGDYEKAEEVTESNYKKNPDYLFAKLNYAEICIQKRELEKIPEIFDNKFELKVLYPERNKFHISEVIGFWGVTGIYFALRGYTQQAQLCYKNLKQLAPKHPFTKKLGNRLMLLSIKNQADKFEWKF